MKSIKKKAVAFISILALVFSFSSFFPLHVFAMADTYSTISAGWNYSMAIKEDGSLWGWGRNSGGQLGDGTTDERDTPVHIMDDVVSVSAGFFHTLAIKSDGSLWGWGNNDMCWALGETVTGTQTTPVKLFDNVRSAVAGYDCSLVIMNDGTLWGAGDSSILHSYTGPDSTESNKGFYLMLTDVIDASASAYSAFAITSDGALWAAGDKSNPAMGFGKDATGWTKGFEKIFDEVVSVDTENGTGLAYGTTAIVRTDDSLWVCGGWMDSSADRYEPERLWMM